MPSRVFPAKFRVFPPQSSPRLGGTIIATISSVRLEMDAMVHTRWPVRATAIVRGALMLAVVATVDVATSAGVARADDGGGAARRGSRAAASVPAATNRGDTVRPSEVLLVQVLLDRAGFSVGEIDGATGMKTKKALAAFQTAKGLPATGIPDVATYEALGGQRSPTVGYRIAAADVSGPFVESIPSDLSDQGELTALSYKTPLEQFAERFHTSPTLLRKLNPGAKFVEGEEVVVPDVEPSVYPTVTERRAAKTVETAARTDAVLISKGNSDVVVQDASGQVLFYAPVSSGSDHDPLPLGDWKVLDVFLMPRFNYNPDLFWDADPKHAKTKIAPGPNNPVGVVWISLDREHYGLHGTPEPSKIGITQSHGCVRLTNWDALRLAALVQPGTRVVFRP
jgi:lipoprotein-anchoring transpeptidase ErfK/SrfK